MLVYRLCMHYTRNVMKKLKTKFYEKKVPTLELKTIKYYNYLSIIIT